MPVHGTSGFSALQPTNRANARARLLYGMAAVGFTSAITAPALQFYGKRTKRKLKAEVRRLKARRKFLPPSLVDAFIGAIGEIGQLAVLYPLDTIKVRCQAQGASTTAVWAGVKSQGFNKANLGSLFAGCGPSAVCAALIGACYLASFCTAKRAIAKATIVANKALAPLSSSANNSSESSIGGDDKSKRSSAARSGDQPGSEEGAIAETLEQDEKEMDDIQGSAANDTAAALVASLLTSVIEAPVELFRHRMQAGLSHGRMLNNMATAFGGEGLTSLYWGYAPFLLKGIPYDVAELFSYSQLTQHQERVPVLSVLPMACRDCIIGALAGAAAVVFSMPADCIKTQMELGANRPPPGLWKGSVAFIKTGRTMWAQQGAKSMFIGMTPRLLENVPSTMFYWVLVAALRRALKPWTDDGDDLDEQSMSAI